MDIDKRKEENLASFVFDLNNDLNEIKDNNEKDFAIESITERKSFGDFNFD